MVGVCENIANCVKDEHENKPTPSAIADTPPERGFWSYYIVAKRNYGNIS